MNHLEALDISTGGDLSDVYRPHVARLTSPTGEVFYIARTGLCTAPADGIQFASSVVAHGAGQAFIGFDPHAFWESERRSADIARKKYRGWRAEAIFAGA